MMNDQWVITWVKPCDGMPEPTRSGIILFYDSDQTVGEEPHIGEFRLAEFFDYDIKEDSFYCRNESCEQKYYPVNEVVKWAWLYKY